MMVIAILSADETAAFVGDVSHSVAGSFQLQ